MLKTHYKKELLWSQSLKKGSAAKKEVTRLQSWLMLHEMAAPGTISVIGIDGDFGNATMQAVKLFQRKLKLPESGVADMRVLDALVLPLKKAFEGKAVGSTLAEYVVSYATNHLNNHPFELTIRAQANCGPWVRSYMDGNEGQSWWWCMGFVQAVVDQAFSAMGLSFKQFMPHTYSCDSVGMNALNNGSLVRYSALRKDPSLARPGDIFLVQKSPYDWIHTGIITRADNDVFETIEGNTNRAGSPNGDRVFRRIRNFRLSKIDVVQLPEM